MPSDSWANGWITGDVVTAAEFKKGVGCVGDTTLGVAAASISISVPTTYAQLLVTAYLRGDSAVTGIETSLRLNADAGTNYDYGVASFNNATTVAPISGFAATSLALTGGTTPAGTSVANTFGSLSLTIPNYANTSNHKNAHWQFNGELAAAAASMWNSVGGGKWKSTAAISQITLLAGAGNFVAGSRVSVYVMGS